jgi:RNA-directed DNA polymerase
VFHPDSYGYRPDKSAHQALGMARQRCWRCDWVLDLDIKGFFDNLEHTLLVRALRKHTACPWVLLYVVRWLQAPVQGQDGTLVPRGQGVIGATLLVAKCLSYAYAACGNALRRCCSATTRRGRHWTEFSVC